MRVEHIGNATLYLGDCLEILPRLPRVDVVVTDPPYSSGGMFRGDRSASTSAKYQSSDAKVMHPDFAGDNRDQRSFLLWSSIWLSMALQVVKPGGMAMVFSDWRQLPTMTDALQVGGWVWRGIVPWNKVNARPQPNRFRAQCEYIAWGSSGALDSRLEGAQYWPGILTEIPPSNTQRKHSTQKPVGIMRTLCEVAPPRTGIVLDPFMGSGTTGVAAMDIGRHFVGIEKEPRYFDIACRRIEAAQQQLMLAGVAT